MATATEPARYVHLDIKPANIVCFELEYKKELRKWRKIIGA